MKIATWNVNSIRVRLPQALAWLERHKPDILCLQETKVPDDGFPAGEFREAGYHAVFAGQKTYNGVATLSRAPAQAVVTVLTGADGEQRRLIAADIGGVRVVNVYVPNGEAVGCDKYAYKLGWLKALTRHLRDELGSHPRVVLVGDFNIAPEERDVHDSKLWAGQVLVSDREREAFRVLLELGLIDVFRLFGQPEQSFTWWDYRMQAFRQNHGLRIDHILCGAALAERCTACTIDVEPRRAERPSDHAPVVAEFAP
ncbi:MAG: exodeoxyribonuclease III [Candidatus Muproteobacteria bacterium RBG_16_65_34]|uniref:Exodeoxyribonuclease III n=1 Tax=Candidatus Muproteobacteria bacterium RBG_16_65_34 TaxID=1817760 RepID=A0A1F6TTK4_9PROT|nr:MAG: exodeoxyribonuclease III [Candidatus Muproteobacteria bacterium RBG_16_65_34]